MDYYLITIKSRGIPYTTKMELDIFYHRCLNIFKNGDWSAFRCYEITAKGRRLHLHTILALPKGTYLMPLITSVNGYRIYMHCKRFPEGDYNNVCHYIQKQQMNTYELEQVLIQNEYYHKYGFLD